LAQVCSPTAQAKAATAQVQRRKWKLLMLGFPRRIHCYFRNFTTYKWNFFCLHKDKGVLFEGFYNDFVLKSQEGMKELSTIASLVKEKWGDTTKAGLYNVEK
jgi:hypothetical protein